MNLKHAKSPCCGERIRHFGRRRRQCAQCKHTWTVRPKKRGRPTHRTAQSVLERVFLQGYTLSQLFSKRSGVALPAFRYRFREALRRFAARPPSQEIPSGPLVLLADGLWFEFEGKPWVLYLRALKSCSYPYAIFLDPLLFPGREGISRWKNSLAAIPPGVRQRIRALVVDNLPGMQLLAKREGWVLQLCHFHLILKLQVHRRGIRYALKGGKVRQEIYDLIRNSLTLPQGAQLERVLNRLHLLSLSDCGTARIQTTVRQFLNEAGFYRSYLTHPELGLPTTTNAVESMGRIIREMFRRSRSGSNPDSLLLWATVLLRMRPRVTCNGSTLNRKT